MIELLHTFVNTIVDLVQGMGYLGIFLLMVIESSFIPFPSEVVLIPAGYLCQRGELTLLGVILAGTGGSLIGAYINYFLARSLGRRFILKFGKYFFLPESKFLPLEKSFIKHGSFATFFGRLIFGVRQWISIPAGIARMSLPLFTVLTTLGAGIWVVILVALGYVLGEGQEAGNYAKLIGYWLLGFVAVSSVAYFYWWVPKKNRLPIDHLVQAEKTGA